MKKLSGKASLFILTAVALTLAGGCSKQENGTETKAGTADLRDQNIRLDIYSSSTYPKDRFDERYGKKFREKFPNWTINYIPKTKDVSMDTLIASGQKVDLVWDSIGLYPDTIMKYNLQFDMSDLIAKRKIDLNRFEPTMVDAMKKMSGGGMYGLPVNDSTLVLYYNKDIFNKFGVAYPKDGMTWDEVIPLASKMTRVEGGVPYLGFASSVTHMVRTNQLSLSAIDQATGRSAMNNDGWKKFFQTIFVDPAQSTAYKDWYKANPANATPGTTSYIKDQQVAMFAYLLGFDNADINRMNWDIVSMPTFKDKPGIGVQTYPTYWGVTSTSANKEAAMQVIEYLVSDEFQLYASKLGQLTVLKNESVRSAIGQDLTDPGAKGKNVKAIYYNKPAPIPYVSAYSQEVSNILTRRVSDVVLEKTDLNSYLRESDELGNKKIDELSKK
ncbi:hypothetical protein PAESOLCIP111_02106 [Paenibacillus solanacearum]|uniref:Extracellular solute-binding protein n=1 Tax=Paenibacillus solanacearum TaxID=2048548 RepID=A0A916NP99_9BACL|nr:ABC transporter substrate-binding protein [Paenibacillus solanacearum]CAG7618346.1 hypothetical protein PAESOLCIP111_02106 [Paenibacillus solanacearum]